MRSPLSRNHLVSSPSQNQQDAAWEFLTAVRELFPPKYEELEALGSDQYFEDLEEPWDQRWNELGAIVGQWTATNRIACPAINHIAMRIAAGQQLPDHAYFLDITDEDGNPIRQPAAIRARPNETRDKFLERAKAHFSEMRQFYLEHGLKEAPLKREREHFRFLAAHLIGGHSFADITQGRTPFKFPSVQYTTVTSGARDAARLIGISLPTKPGPRPGSRTPRRRRWRT